MTGNGKKQNVINASNFVIRTFQMGDEETVIELWRRCDLVVPWNDPHRDIARKMAVQPDLFLVGTLENRVVATLMAGYDGHRGWLNYLAVDLNWQRCGFGRLLVEEAELRLEKLRCPKINLQVRATNAAVIGFYRALGFQLEDTLSLGKRLENDELDAESTLNA